MAGRWARLAVRAFTTSALDFTRVSADNPKSLIREEFVFDEIDRQLRYQTDIGTALCTLIAPLKPEYLMKQGTELFRSVNKGLRPWRFKEGPSAQTSPENMDPEELENFYFRMRDNARKMRELKRQQEEEENGG